MSEATERIVEVQLERRNKDDAMLDLAVKLVAADQEIDRMRREAAEAAVAYAGQIDVMARQTRAALERETDLEVRIERATVIMARHNHADLMSDDEWGQLRAILEAEPTRPSRQTPGSDFPSTGSEVGFADGQSDKDDERDASYEGLMAVIAASDDYIKAEADYQVSQMIGDGTTDWAAFGKAQATLFAYDKAKRDTGLPRSAQKPADAATTSATVTPKRERKPWNQPIPTNGPRRTFDDEAVAWGAQEDTPWPTPVAYEDEALAAWQRSRQRAADDQMGDRTWKAVYEVGYADGLRELEDYKALVESEIGTLPSDGAAIRRYTRNLLARIYLLCDDTPMTHDGGPTDNVGEIMDLIDQAYVDLRDMKPTTPPNIDEVHDIAYHVGYVDGEVDATPDPTMVQGLTKDDWATITRAFWFAEHEVAMFQADPTHDTNPVTYAEIRRGAVLLRQIMHQMRVGASESPTTGATSKEPEAEPQGGREPSRGA